MLSPIPGGVVDLWSYYPVQKIETAENHDVERTLFDVLEHKRSAKIAFSGCALGADCS